LPPRPVFDDVDAFISDTANISTTVAKGKIYKT
jgi:hypothetical protein